MKQQMILAMMLTAAVTAACSDDSDGDANRAGAGGSAGVGAGGSAGLGGGAGNGSTNNGGAAGSAPPPTPALAADAPTVACPTVINGALESTDPTQTGRHSRVAPVSACGATKAFPGNAADPSNPHLYDVYRFVNSAASPVCFSFALTYGANAVGAGDAGADAGADAGVALAPGIGLDAGLDAGPAPAPAALKYLTAYSTFYPTDLSQAHLGDVGDNLASPQTMGITVPAGETIDVVVYGIDVAPAGVGSYTLSCSTQ